MKRVMVGVATMAVLIAIGLASTAAATHIILLGGGHTDEFDGSKASYVAHGWGRDVVPGVPASVVHDDMRLNSFELTIDGVDVKPTTVHVTRIPEVHNPRGVDGWSLSFVFRFPAKYFTSGTHEFIGTWISPDPDNPGENIYYSVVREIVVYYP